LDGSFRIRKQEHEVLKTALNFFILVCGNVVMYYGLFKLMDWSATKSLFYPVLKLAPARLEWIQFWKFESLGGYVVGFGIFATLFVFMLGGMLFNWAYLSEGLRHGQDLFFPQFLVWGAAPISFTIMNWIYYNHLPDGRTWIAFLLLVVAQVVLRWK